MEGPDWGKFLQYLLESALTVLVPALIVFASQWLKQKRAETEHYVGESHWAAFEEAARTAYRAAEQAGIREHFEKDGQRKLQLAINTAERYLYERGLGGLDLDVLVDMIEAEVNRHKSSKPG